MSLKFVDYSVEPMPDRLITSQPELTAFLTEITEPIAGELIHDNGYMLMIGIDGSLAFVQYSPATHDVPYLIALAPEKVVADFHDFIVTNEATEIDGKFCLPLSVFKEIVSHFLQTGQQSTKVQWEEI